MKKQTRHLLHALREVFLGRRGILKMGQIWLPLSLILFSGSRLAAGSELYASLLLLYAVVSKGLSSILFNDLTDREIDRRAGKERWITSLPSPVGVLLPVLLLASGFPVLIMAGGDLPVLASFTVTAALGVLYSLKPVRFKERGLWGIAAYALAAAILHALVPWTLFRPAYWLLPLLLCAVTGDKLVQILFHQILDFDSDRQEKIGSFAVKIGRDKALRILRFILIFAVAADAVLLITALFLVSGKFTPFIWLIGPACLLGILGAAVYTKIISKRAGTSTALTRKLPWPYLGTSYVTFYLLPPMLLLAIALRSPEMAILTALSVLTSLGMSINLFFYSHMK